MKIIISEEQKKKLFIPRDLDGREVEYQKFLNLELDKIRNSPIGKITKDSIFEWIQENNLDRTLKLVYKGPTLGEVVASSYNKSTGDVTLYLETDLDLSFGEVAITFKISDINIGLGRISHDSEDTFHSI